MSNQISPVNQHQIALRGSGFEALPEIVLAEGPKTTKRFLEFFTVTIRNLNTRAAYARACGSFLDWCHQ